MTNNVKETNQIISVDKIAKLARLELTKEEKVRFQIELENILSAFKELDKIDTNSVEPSFQPIPVKDILREDKVENVLNQKTALSNTTNKENGYFKGPRAV